MPFENLNTPNKKRSIKRRVGRLSAYGVSIIALVAAAPAPATAHSFKAHGGAEAARGLNGPETKPPKSSLEPDLRSTADAIEKINKSKDPNVFYGAVFIPGNVGASSKVSDIYKSVDIRPNGLDSRIGVLDDGPVIILDPICVNINGRKYLVGTDRGPNKDPSLYDSTFKDASTARRDVVKLRTRFIDYEEAMKNNDGQLIYFGHNGSKAQMVHSEVRDGLRYIGDSLPQYNPTGSFLHDFDSSIDIRNPLVLDSYLGNKGFWRIQPGLTPKFDKLS